MMYMLQNYTPCPGQVAQLARMPCQYAGQGTYKIQPSEGINK